jgi:hypothetical protein
MYLKGAQDFFLNSFAVPLGMTSFNAVDELNENK